MVSQRQPVRVFQTGKGTSTWASGAPKAKHPTEKTSAFRLNGQTQRGWCSHFLCVRETQHICNESAPRGFSWACHSIQLLSLHRIQSSIMLLGPALSRLCLHQTPARTAATIHECASAAGSDGWILGHGICLGIVIGLGVIGMVLVLLSQQIDRICLQCQMRRRMNHIDVISLLASLHSPKQRPSGEGIDQHCQSPESPHHQKLQPRRIQILKLHA